MIFSVKYRVSYVINISIIQAIHSCAKVNIRNLRNMCSTMSSNLSDPRLLLPPEDVRGMKDLDKTKFRKSIVVPWVPVNEKHVGGITKCMKKYILKMVYLKPLQPYCVLLEGEEIMGDVMMETTANVSKRLLLNPLLIKSFEDIDENHRTVLNSMDITAASLMFSKIILNYSNWRADEILKAVLPEDKEGFSSYSIIGHIAHVNIRDHLLPFKQVIGQVLLDKATGIKTVVNKTDIIDNTYRNFKMEIICGESNLTTRTKENNCTFELDFSAVYWNPRLCTEHERIVNKLKEGDILYDVCSGIGPFAIPAAKKKCYVLANDLNPESYKWLNRNIKLNKVHNLITTFNKDGRDFILHDIKKDILVKWQSKQFTESTIHVTMNLPALAVTFLSAFKGLFSNESLPTTIKNFPVVHVYCFVFGDNIEDEAKMLVENNLGVSVQENILEIHNVRNVSPKKEMMRVSFKLTKEVLTHTDDRKHDFEEEQPAKKICLEKVNSIS